MFTHTLVRRACIVVLLSAPLIADAQTGAPTDFKGLANLVVQILSSATAVLIALAGAYYLWGVALSIKDAGSAKAWEQFRVKIVWGLLALFVMFSIYGIIRVLGNTLFGGTGGFSSFN